MWKKIISDLISAGMTEAQIAAHVQYTQPSVHRLKTGAMKEPSYSKGRALIALHQVYCKPEEVV